jgi:hypothetical protein
MRRLVDLYEKLPRGAAPEEKATGLLGRYRKRYMDGKGSAMRKLGSRVQSARNADHIQPLSISLRSSELLDTLKTTTSTSVSC